ncbi:MAG: epoxide hydrolase family protein [Thermomicrobiales bacterium]
MTDAQPFTVHVPQADLTDLDERLARTRWADDRLATGWTYGVSDPVLRDLVTHWRTTYDWRQQEARLNAVPNFRMPIDDLPIHFLHVRGKGPAPTPLLLVHGYPSTPWEFLPLIERLTDPVAHGGDARDAFDIVAPSIPGHGFSPAADRIGFEDREVGRIFARLMTALGYDRFGIHGYDIGASISGYLCLDHPDRVIGYHTTNPGNPGPVPGPDSPPPSEAERAFAALRQVWRHREGAYAHILETKHRALAYALTDSPVGLAAWILDKWFAWTSPPGGNLADSVSMDDLLTTIMIYWLTGTIDDANRYYAELPDALTPDDRITVPTGVLLPTHDPTSCPPRELVARLHTDIRHWAEVPAGHFPAVEQPTLVAESIVAFFRLLRTPSMRADAGSRAGSDLGRDQA